MVSGERNNNTNANWSTPPLSALLCAACCFFFLLGLFVVQYISRKTGDFRSDGAMHFTMIGVHL